MALGAVFFSFPAALIGVFYLAMTKGISAFEALAIYTGLGLSMLVAMTLLAAIPAGKEV